MNTANLETSVGEFVRAVPARARIFEKYQIDYCCGGKKPLAEACAERKLDPEMLLVLLVAVAEPNEGEDENLESLSVAELCDYIVKVHHGYLRIELPRLDFMTHKVAARHGDTEPRLAQIREIFQKLSEDIVHHVREEEQVVFPRLRALAESGGAGVTADELQGMLAQLEGDHAEVGDALAALRVLSDGFTPPEWACNTFRAMYDGLADLERDMHQHVHQENNVLFPRALAAFAA
jgi:regulator of cell morphogenesis and NO signaling